MEKITIKKTHYLNGVSCKLKNSRATVVAVQDDFVLQLRIIDNETPNIPRSVHEVLKNKVVQTTLKLSPQGLYALYSILKTIVEKENMYFKPDKNVNV
jgi:hypothetical protein